MTANGYQQVKSPGAPEGIELLKLDKSYEIVLIQGRNLAGVHDASSPEAALDLAAAVKAALKGKP